MMSKLYLEVRVVVIGVVFSEWWWFLLLEMLILWVVKLDGVGIIGFIDIGVFYDVFVWFYYWDVIICNIKYCVVSEVL